MKTSTLHLREAGSLSGASSHGSTPEEWIAVVAAQVKATRFGVVQIVIHDSKVVQIDHTERTRFEGAGAGKVNRPLF